jgi:plastocyanin
MLGSRHAFALFASIAVAAGCGSSGEEAVPAGDAASEAAPGGPEDALTTPVDAAEEAATAPEEATTPGPTMMAVSIPAGAVGKGTGAYVPNPATITVGSTVTWTNNDTLPHTATSDTGVWDSGTLSSGQSFSFTFMTAGTFPYHCMIHGAQSMSGTVTVQ